MLLDFAAHEHQDVVVRDRAASAVGAGFDFLVLDHRVQLARDELAGFLAAAHGGFQVVENSRLELCVHRYFEIQRQRRSPGMSRACQWES